MKIDLIKSIPENCPSFDKCGTNACPLHKNYHKTLFDFPDDKLIPGWRKCRASKKVRMRIAEAFNLKNKGLTKREFFALQLREEFAEADNLSKKEDNIFLTKDFEPETPKNKVLGEARA